MLLNSTLTRFIIEFSCRQLTGAQAIADIDVSVVENCLIPWSKKIERSRDKFKMLHKELLENNSLSILKEIGTTNVEKIQLKNIEKYRRNIDSFVMGDILGLSEDEQLEVYKAVVDLVRSRLERAKSMGNNKKKNGRTGINIDAVVDSVVSQIGKGKIKKWYREKILSQKKLRMYKLPESEDNIAIEKSLFGWQIKYGRKNFPCKSEMEAQYLKIWIDIGVEKIKVPEDEKYLKKCVSELKKMKEDIDGKIDSLVGSILDKKLKKVILHRIWQRL